jgi:hypothetical protein
MTYTDIDRAIAEGPVLAGSPQQIIDKIMYWHEAFGHELQSFSLPTIIPHEQQLDMLERLATEVIPVVLASAPSTLWSAQDRTAPGRPGRGEPSPTPPRLSARPPGIRPYRRSIKRGEVRLWSARNPSPLPVSSPSIGARRCLLTVSTSQSSPSFLTPAGA